MGVNSGSGFVSSGGGGGGTNPAHIYANALFVDPNGDDLTAVKGDLHLPYATLGGALDNVVDGDVIVMFAGNYSVNYTIESRLTGTPEFSIISQGKVVITTSVTSFINDAVGHNYTINGDFDIIGHSGASIINISNANSSLQIRINKITQDGNFVMFCTSGSPIFKFNFMVISNNIAIICQDSNARIIAGDVDGSVGITTFYSPSFGANDVIIANRDVGEPVMLLGNSFYNVTGSAVATDRFTKVEGITVKSIGAVVGNEQACCTVRRNSSVLFKDCLLIIDTVTAVVRFQQIGALNINATFDDCRFWNQNTTSSSAHGLWNISAENTQIKLVFIGVNIIQCDSVTAQGIASSDASGNISTKIQGEVFTNRDTTSFIENPIGTTTNLIVDSNVEL